MVKQRFSRASSREEPRHEILVLQLPTRPRPPRRCFRYVEPSALMYRNGRCETISSRRQSSIVNSPSSLVISDLRSSPYCRDLFQLVADDLQRAAWTRGFPYLLDESEDFLQLGLEFSISSR